MGEEKKDINSPRAPVRDKIDEVLDQLYDLKKRLDEHNQMGPGSGMLDKCNYFSRVSDAGRSCTYYLKAKHVFLNREWAEIQNILLDLLSKIRSVPGESDFGKK